LLDCASASPLMPNDSDGGGDGHRAISHKAPAIKFDLSGHFNFVHAYSP
jgi:hypothetical protein